MKYFILWIILLNGCSGKWLTQDLLFLYDSPVNETTIEGVDHIVVDLKFNSSINVDTREGPNGKKLIGPYRLVIYDKSKEYVKYLDSLRLCCSENLTSFQFTRPISEGNRHTSTKYHYYPKSSGNIEFVYSSDVVQHREIELNFYFTEDKEEVNGEHINFTELELGWFFLEPVSNQTKIKLHLTELEKDIFHKMKEPHLKIFRGTWSK